MVCFCVFTVLALSLRMGLSTMLHFVTMYINELCLV